MVEEFSLCIRTVYNTYAHLEYKLETEAEFFVKARKCILNKSELVHAIPILIKCMKSMYRNCAIIIIDDYDTPLETARRFGYYDEACGFFQSVYSAISKVCAYASYYNILCTS